MLEKHFAPFRKHIIGIDQTFQTPFGEKRILYADWTASGRLYGPIEERLRHQIYPFVGNTHTETSVTGSAMTLAYHEAMAHIKRHVNASGDDVIISSNSGMTGVINKFQRILGFKIHERYKDCLHLTEKERPVVFVTHMEHHSNHTSWLETIADVKVINPTPQGRVDLEHLNQLLEQYAHRNMKIAAITSCSNVTGVMTPYHQIAGMLHRAGGYCFVDFAASAPYIPINMHPADSDQYLDAIYFSPHKFLGGPGSSGVLIFNKALYQNQIPDHPGGGTVDWTNPWGQHKYVDDIEAREDGGTPAFLQTMKTAFTILLKEEMEPEKMLQREEEIVEKLWKGLKAIPGMYILAENLRERLGIISFYLENIHYNLAVKLLNDKFGIQTRGGCSCAGTYGHYLLHVDPHRSRAITDSISQGDLSVKPGWVRLSIHPTMTDAEVDYILTALHELSQHYQEWQQHYRYVPSVNEYVYTGGDEAEQQLVHQWFGHPITPNHQ